MKEYIYLFPKRDISNTVLHIFLPDYNIFFLIKKKKEWDSHRLIHPKEAKKKFNLLYVWPTAKSGKISHFYDFLGKFSSSRI